MSDQTADLGTADLEVDGEAFAIVAYRLDGVVHVEFQDSDKTIAAMVKEPGGVFEKEA